MPAPDLNFLGQEISSKISSAKTAIASLKDEKELKRSAANSTTKNLEQITSQLDKVKDLQKRYQKNPPNSTDQLLNFINQTKGQGSSTLKYLRKKILEAATKIEPKAAAILKEESMKALGCSQEQTYVGVTENSLQLQPLPLRPQQEGIYIPVQSVDFFSNLKNSPDSAVGKVYYEQPEPSADQTFKPFGGIVNFPMNKQLYQLMDSSNAGRSLSQILGKNYKGKSGQNLFDVQYTKTNSFGVTGDYFRVLFIDRNGNPAQGVPSGTTVNKVGEFISDYYSTINLVDPVDIGAQVVNVLSGAMNIKAGVGYGELENQSKFAIVLQRILGLCFDDRREIDVSGVAKVAELDGVDDTFFEFNEIDLRNIDIQISNVQNGVMEFEDCDNVKVPVDAESLVDQLAQFRQSLSGQTNEQKVATLEQIIDSISQNPEWKPKLPNTFDASVSIDQNVLKKMTLAVAAGILTPKNLLPIYSLLSVVQSGATYTYNQAVTSGNTLISSANTLINSASTIYSSAYNVVTDGTDFLKKWKTFSIETISKLNAVFLETLFLILKKDLLNLISSITQDIEKEKKLKKYSIIIRLVGLTLIVLQTLQDYRKCKPLLEDILVILNMVNGLGFKIPISLLALTPLLPGTSPQGAFINVIEELQKLGVPTGTLPDGSPNLMLLYNLATHRGIHKDENLNGYVLTTGGVGKKL